MSSESGIARREFRINSFKPETVEDARSWLAILILNERLKPGLNVVPKFGVLGFGLGISCDIWIYCNMRLLDVETSCDDKNMIILSTNDCLEYSGRMVVVG